MINLLPKEFKDYANVFSSKDAKRLLPYYLCNYNIQLIKEKTPYLVRINLAQIYINREQSSLSKPLFVVTDARNLEWSADYTNPSQLGAIPKESELTI